MLALVMCLASCSSSDNGGDSTNISLSKDSLSVSFLGIDSIKVNGIDASKCNVKIENVYFANQVGNNTGNGYIKFMGCHVGTTKAVISYNGLSKECVINVTPLVSMVGSPILDFGTDSTSLKNEETHIHTESFTDNNIHYIDYEDMTTKSGGLSVYYDYAIFHRYYFSGNKLTSVLTYLDTESYMNDEGFLNKILSDLVQKYTYIGIYNGKNQKIHIYKSGSGYCVGMRYAYGNGGWYIYYAQTMQEVTDELDVNSSFSLY